MEKETKKESELRLQFTKAKRKNYQLLLWITVVVTAVSLIAGVSCSLHLFFTDIYPVMTSEGINWFRKVVRWILYILPYIPAVVVGRNIRFFYNNMMYWTKREKEREEEC